MASSIISTSLATMTVSKVLPTSSTSQITSVTFPQSTQSALPSSQILTYTVSSVSRNSSRLRHSFIASFSDSKSSSSSSFLPSFSSTTATTPTAGSATQIISTLSIPVTSSSISASSSTSSAMSLFWIAPILVFSIAIVILAIGCYVLRRRSVAVEDERTSTPIAQGWSRPWTDMEVRPGLIRRTTTWRIREDWQQWIARPPPMRNAPKRSDSAVLLGTGTVSRSTVSFQPLLSAYEVEASGVLDVDNISDPPPAYTPRRI